MKEIQCSVWGVIRVSELALSIIDTFIFQRLHYIKQTGLAYKVFQVQQQHGLHILWEFITRQE